MRIANKPHTSIHYEKPIHFHFNGKAYQGYAGDSLASALLAEANQPLMRSFKYGRKRGLFAAGIEEPNALVSLEQGGQYSPNLKATEVELYDGLIARSAVKVDGLDVRALLKPLHRFMPAGFYYKTFIKQAFWNLVEGHLRKLSGFSEAPQQKDDQPYEHQYLHAEILVVGGGAAGLSAALTALKENSEARIILVDERSQLGGELCSEVCADETARGWLEQTLAALRDASSANNAHGAKRLRLFSRTTAYAWHDHNFVQCLQRLSDHLPTSERQGKLRQRILHIRAKQVILASGAHERPMLFENNDIINVMLAQSVQRYLNQYGVLSGQRVVLYGNNDSLVGVALSLAGFAQSVALIDIRQDALSEEAKQQLVAAGVELQQSMAVLRAIGSDSITGVEICGVEYQQGDWLLDENTKMLQCDLLATSGGFSPVIHLACHSETKPSYDAHRKAFVVGSADNYKLAGSVDDCLLWQDAVESGRQAAIKALCGQSLLPEQELGKLTSLSPQSLHTSDFFVPEAIIRRPKVFLDLQNDVKSTDLYLAISEGYDHIELIKRYTALGFGTDQGKTGNINGAAVAARILNLGIEEVGTTTFRPAYTPVALGALAGHHKKQFFEPERYTPIQPAHVAAGAEFELVGQWYRPWYFPKKGETMDDAVQRECLAARESLAMMDASTLGKIDIQGKDAREFLSRVYTNAWMKLPPGRCRYGIMCDEKGMIIDDGVTSCISEEQFIMTTTTGGAASVYSTLEMWLQTEWSDLDVYLSSVTDQYATIAVVGPEARKLMRLLSSDIDFSAEQFKFMDWRAGKVCGVPARVMRISFSGELAYEINVQANYGLYIWQQVAKHGKEWNITPYGTETLHVLRAEKGYIIVGQDTDGSVTPMDANMNWALAKNKSFSYIGQRSFQLPSLQAENRKQLVGIHTEDPHFVLPEGSHLIGNSGQSIGHIASSYYSPNCQRSIALALVKDGLNRMGESIQAHLIQPKYHNRKVACKIVNSVHYDPQGGKVDGNG